ncbi:MAG: phage tail tape measure protein [Planctomycetales bacterium]|nr:phage tail tape measure protein [Planctomycetales bacterium]
MPAVRDIKAGSAYVELSTRDSKLVRGLQRAVRRLNGFAASVKATGLKLIGMGTAAAAPFALSARTFANFESQMARVQALTGAQGDEFERLERTAKRLGATTVFSASQAAEAMSSFALAGFDVDKILGAIGPTLDLAAAGQIEIAQAADIAAKIMAGMGLSADELGNAVDVMAKAMTTANTDLTMLGDAFKFVGPMAKTAGVSLEEVTAAIQLLSNAGIQGEMAGTTLRGMLLSLTSPSSEAQNELDRLGVRVLDSAGNVRSLADIIGDLENALASVGSGERLRSLGTIFPARQAAGAAELVAQGAERLRDATSALGSATGTASRIASTQLDTLMGDFTILLSALEGVGIAIGEAFGTQLRAAIRGVTAMLSIAGEWIQQNRQIVVAAIAVVAGVITLGSAMVAAGLSINIAAFALSGFAVALKIGAAVVGAILSPIGLLTAAVLSLGGYLVYASGVGGKALAWLGERFGQLMEDASTAWKAIGDALASGDVSLAARILWLTLKMEWQRGVNFLEGLWLKFKDSFLTTTSNLTFEAARLMTDGWAGIEVAWTETIAFLSDSWSLFTNLLTKTWHSTVGFIRKAWVRLKSLFDSDVDVEAEVTRINKETRAASEAADSQMLGAIGERDRERRARRRQIESDRQGAQVALTDMQSQQERQRESQHAADMAESERQLAEARRQWQEAIGEVTKVEAQAEGESLPEAIEKMQSTLAASNQTLASEQEKIETQGSFNAFALLGIGGNSAGERTAKATEAMDKKMGKLLNEAQHGGLVFS